MCSDHIYQASLFLEIKVQSICEIQTEINVAEYESSEMKHNT